jgi:hypothetical protein
MAIPTDENGIARLRLTNKDAEVGVRSRRDDSGELVGKVDAVVLLAVFNSAPDNVTLAPQARACENKTR